jgi:hypothetical protein
MTGSSTAKAGTLTDGSEWRDATPGMHLSNPEKEQHTCLERSSPRS